MVTLDMQAYPTFAKKLSVLPLYERRAAIAVRLSISPAYVPVKYTTHTHTYTHLYVCQTISILQLRTMSLPPFISLASLNWKKKMNANSSCAV